MKKLAAAILLFVYLTVTTGFVVSVHYCMNRIDSVQLGDSSEKECGKCGMHIEDSNGCCKDDVKVVKLQVDHSFAKISYADFSLATLPVSHLNEFLVSLHSGTEPRYPLAHGPPLNKQDTYLQNCVFRI